MVYILRVTPSRGGDLGLGPALQIALGGQYDYRGALVRYRHLEARALPADEPLAGSP